MTEQEAVKIIKRLNFCGLCTTGPCGNCERKQAKDTVLSALEEIQQYRTIGTVEEITVDLAEYRDLCKPEEIAHMKSLKRIIENCNIKCERKRKPPDALFFYHKTGNTGPSAIL